MSLDDLKQKKAQRPQLRQAREQAAKEAKAKQMAEKKKTTGRWPIGEMILGRYARACLCEGLPCISWFPQFSQESWSLAGNLTCDRLTLQATSLRCRRARRPRARSCQRAEA